MSNATESESTSATRANQPAQHTERKDSQKPRHAAEATRTQAPTTVPPCPEWCQLTMTNTVTQSHRFSTSRSLPLTRTSSTSRVFG
jgi:hypothetical protein